MDKRVQLPPEVEAYFAKGRRRLTAVCPEADYTLLLTFDNGEKRRYDMKPAIAKGGVMACLKDRERFGRVYLNDTHCVAWDIDPTVDSATVWENVIDLCPDSCYLYSRPLGKEN